ncbi:MAG TPA: DUF1365 domain-containing protein [Roseimicrobium sp.]|nr:DUF1365 domain-containing protein [Roseimicrobium sp.]
MELNTRTAFRSCLYECHVMHHRLQPKEHHFDYRIFLFYLDLDELPSVSKATWGFGLDRFSLYSFHDSDHLPGSAGRLKQRVLHYVWSQGVEANIDRVMLLTLPRVLGYIFNPVSFYFCFDAQQRPVCSVAEVGNTFGEMKLFPLGPGTLDDTGRFRSVVPKNFYVSPFSELDLAFDFKLAVPGERLDVHIDDRKGGDVVLLSALTGHREPLTSSKLAWFSLKYPLLTLKVITLIHWHALLLWMKRVPWFAKAANPELQQDVLNPHPSIAGRTK